MHQCLLQIQASKGFFFQLPKCTQDEICKEITDMPGEFLVNPICQCPGQMSCPSVAPKKVEVMVYDKQVYLKTQHVVRFVL